jgi:hypothetical protein
MPARNGEHHISADKPERQRDDENGPYAPPPGAGSVNDKT